METKQTAVEWIYMMMHQIGMANDPNNLKILERAKAIHEEQIRDAYCKGVNDAEEHPEGHKINWKQYYNGTYGK